MQGLLGCRVTSPMLIDKLGQNFRGNVYLTPPEMEVLTRRWAPYRSLGVYYMWAVAEDTG